MKATIEHQVTPEEESALNQSLQDKQNKIIADLKQTGKIPTGYLVMSMNGDLITKQGEPGYDEFLALPYATKQSFHKNSNLEERKSLRKGDYNLFLFVKPDLTEYIIAIRDHAGVNQFSCYLLQNNQYMFVGRSSAQGCEIDT